MRPKKLFVKHMFCKRVRYAQRGHRSTKLFWASKRLAFGSAVTTWGHVEKLQTLGITHVIGLRHGKHGKKIREFESLWLPFKDEDPNHVRIGSVVVRCSSTRKACVGRISQSPLHVPSRRFAEAASLTYLLLRADGLRPTRAKSTVLKSQTTRPRGSQQTGESGRKLSHRHRMMQQIISAANPNQERHHETSADHSVLGVFHRHRWSKVQGEESAPGHPQSAVQKTTPGNRASSTTDYEGKTTARIYSDRIVREPVTRPGTTPLSST